MESTGRTKQAEHVTGTGIPSGIDRHAASATRQAATAPASTSLEGTMLNLGYCNVTASRKPVQLTWREKLAGIHDVTGLEAVPEREAAGREVFATFRVRPGDPIFCVVPTLPWSVGDRVEAGAEGTDNNTGTVLEIGPRGYRIGWDSCQQSWAEADELRAIAEARR